MSAFGSFMTAFRGGWRDTFTCLACGNQVLGDEIGMVEVTSGEVYCRTCAEWLWEEEEA